MAPLVDHAVSLVYLGETTDPNGIIARMGDALSATIRRMTRRALEGTATVYDAVYQVDNAAGFTLPHVPIDTVIAVRRTYFDGSEDAVATPRDVAGGASTTLAAAAAIGATNLKLVSMTGLAVGDHLRVGSSTAQEVVRVTSVGTAGAGGTGAGVEPALRYAHALAEAVVEVSGSESWRIASTSRGRIQVNLTADYLRFTWRVTGEIPDDVEQGYLDWLKQGWEQIKDNPVSAPELASQSSDSWSESYIQNEITSITRRPPPSVVLMVGGNFHASGGGPV